MSDDHQLATYLDDYHTALDRVLEPAQPGTEMITELAVPRALFEPFLAALTAQSIGLVPGSAAPLVLAVAFPTLGAMVPRRALTAIVAAAGVVLAGLGHPGVDLPGGRERGSRHRPDRRA